MHMYKNKKTREPKLGLICIFVPLLKVERAKIKVTWVTDQAFY